MDNQAFFSPQGAALPSLTVFKEVVRDGFLLGDTDSDSTLDIPDVTLIQRVCAYADVKDEQAVILRGDLSRDGSLDVIDATYIQRRLAGMYTPYPIGTIIAP